MKAKVYVASSWRNERYPAVVERLTVEGYQVLDWRAQGRWWEAAGLDFSTPVPAAAMESLLHQPAAVECYERDLDLMHAADAGVLLLPAGLSAHIELGYLAGRCPVYVLAEAASRPELIYGVTNAIVGSLDDLVERLDAQFALTPAHAAGAAGRF